MLVKNNKRSAGKQAGHALPPWIACNERDNELMAQWLNKRLDEVQKWLSNYLFDGDNLWIGPIQEKMSELRKAGWSIEMHEARQGNIEPLRKLYPDIAEFIHLPKRPGRGKRFQKSKWKVQEAIFADPKKSEMTWAAWDVATIRDLWERWYKKKKRPESSLSAEEFASDRHKVDLNELCEWMRSRQLPKDLYREQKRNHIFNVKS